MNSLPYSLLRTLKKKLRSLRMPISRRFSIEMRLKAAYLLLPLAQYQGYQLRQNLPEFNSPQGNDFGEVKGKGKPLRLVVLGESTVVGIGAEHKENALAGHLARQLHFLKNRPVEWSAFGKVGLKINQFQVKILETIDKSKLVEADVIVMALGVNDALSFTSLDQWRTGISDAVKSLNQINGRAPILFSGLPPMAHFPILPAPLSWIMGLKAEQLSEELKTCISSLKQAHFLGMPLEKHTALFAEDGMHPSEKGYFEWAHEIVLRGNPFISNGV